MNLSNHPVLTQSYPENLTDGVMVCGINFGYSSKDRAADAEGVEEKLDSPSFFADPTVNQTRFRNTLIKWLENWGVKFARTPAELTSNDKSYFQTNWINSQTTSINSDEKITNQTLIESVEPLLALVRERKPRAIVFVGNLLIEAFNDIRIREKVESVLGPRSGNAQIHKGTPQKLGARAFKVLTQHFGTTTIICVPHTATQGISYPYMASVALPAKVISLLNGNK